MRTVNFPKRIEISARMESWRSVHVSSVIKHTFTSECLSTLPTASQEHLEHTTWVIVPPP
jgi:hypothetical protein